MPPKRRRLPTGTEESQKKRLKTASRGCKTDGCLLTASFGYAEGTRRRQFCKAHMLPGMIYLSGPSCQSKGCNKTALFNFIGGRRGVRCGKHREPGMVDVKHKKCDEVGCRTRPHFNLPTEYVPRKCAKHKLDGMVDVVAEICQYGACTTQSSLNFPGLHKRLFCKSHAALGMVDVTKRTCESPGCTTIPVFNFPNTIGGRFCSTHKLPDMENVCHITCAEPGCKKQPSFNLPGAASRKWCKSHATDDMVRIGADLCAVDGCDIHATFNLPGELKRLYCSSHAKDDMIRLNSDGCATLGCVSTASFNFKRGDKAVACAAHKEEGMINVHQRLCEHATIVCNAYANYGIPGQFFTHCAAHKQPGQIPFPRRKCEAYGCKHPAQFGVRSIPERCEAHHQSGVDRDLVLKRCIVCNNPAQWTPTADDEKQDVNMCDDCAHRQTNLRLRRQRQVKGWLDSQPTEVIQKYDFYDKAVLKQDGCGWERPDFMWQLPHVVVCLEVDEHQHMDRPCECEQIRMANVTQALKMPCLWIRFNPDEYKGQTIAIRDRHRLELLVKVVKHCLSLPPIEKSSEFLRVMHLFFDGFDMSSALDVVNIPLL